MGFQKNTSNNFDKLTHVTGFVLEGHIWVDQLNSHVIIAWNYFIYFLFVYYFYYYFYLLLFFFIFLLIIFF